MNRTVYSRVVIFGIDGMGNFNLRTDTPNDPEHDKPVETVVQTIKMDGAPQFPRTLYPTGLMAYDDYPTIDEEPWLHVKKVVGPSAGSIFKLPCDIRDNRYLNRAIGCCNEIGGLRTEEVGITFKVDGDAVELDFTGAKLLEEKMPGIVTSDALGISFQTESRWTDPDNHPYTLDTDIFGSKRSDTPTAGPIEKAAGIVRLSFII